MYFTTRDPNANYSTLGKGYTAGACSAKDLALHAMLMEYQNDDITFARVPVLISCLLYFTQIFL
jgi:hypothetical protein